MVSFSTATDMIYYLLLFSAWMVQFGTATNMIYYLLLDCHSALPLTWFIRCICYWLLQFLNPVIIIKTKVVLSQAYVASADFWLFWLDPSVFLLPNILKLVGSQIFWPWAWSDEGYSRNTLCPLNFIYTPLLYIFDDMKWIFPNHILISQVGHVHFRRETFYNYFAMDSIL